MSDGVLAIAVHDSSVAIKDGMTTEEMLRATMKQAQDFWLSVDDDVRLRGAIGAVLQHLGTDHADYDDLVQSIDSLKKAGAILNALQAGIMVDISEADTEPPKYKLMELWREAAKAA